MQPLSPYIDCQKFKESQMSLNCRYPAMVSVIILCFQNCRYCKHTLNFETGLKAVISPLNWINDHKFCYVYCVVIVSFLFDTISMIWFLDWRWMGTIQTASKGYRSPGQSAEESMRSGRTRVVFNHSYWKETPILNLMNCSEISVIYRN